MKFLNFEILGLVSLTNGQAVQADQAASSNGHFGSRILAGPYSRTENGLGRRYSQLSKMMKFANPEFDQRKYWTYGCNCMMVGDRPLSSPGFGAAVDPLDQVCKKYKDCVKCAMARHGNQCIGERIMYKFKLRKDNQISCLNTAGSCSRAICECDAAFAVDHNYQKEQIIRYKL